VEVIHSAGLPNLSAKCGQSVTLDSKPKGGIGGRSLEPAALEQWFLTVHEQAAITTSVKNMCNLGEKENMCSHNDAGSQHLTRNEDVPKTMTTLSTVMTNPFDVEDANDGELNPLMHLTTGVLMPRLVC